MNLRHIKNLAVLWPSRCCLSWRPVVPRLQYRVCAKSQLATTLDIPYRGWYRPRNRSQHRFHLRGRVRSPSIRGGLAVSWQMWVALGVFAGFLANVAFFSVSKSRSQLVQVWLTDRG
ncbi:hypothetical protein PG996_011982 [Apiospora saccharicola]|uniref:Uncharacterized protein n=1 Tax=Apiospora saccharicola TaxID=335842 RepID=A0ABR1U1A5_9PEZI